MQNYALIVSGGSGQRMQSALPKQFIEVQGQTILEHTLDKFLALDLKIVLVLPLGHIDFFKEKHLKAQIISGGSTRFESVKNGLAVIPDNALVAIHDGVRPLVSTKLIEKGFELLRKHDGAIPCVELKNSIRKKTATGSQALNRAEYMAVQTPQFFKTSSIKAAYQQQTDARQFTDDASVFEASQQDVFCFKGEAQNIKITTPIDLAVFKALLKT